MQSFDRLYLLGMSSVSSCPMPFTTCFILLVLTSPPVLPTTRSHLLRFLLFTQLVYIYPSVIRFMSSLFYILKFPGQNLENLISSTKLIKSVCHQPTQQAPALFRAKGEISRTCALYLKKKKTKKKLPTNLTVACHADQFATVNIDDGKEEDLGASLSYLPFYFQGQGSKCRLFNLFTMVIDLINSVDKTNYW